MACVARMELECLRLWSKLKISGGWRWIESGDWRVSGHEGGERGVPS